MVVPSNEASVELNPITLNNLLETSLFQGKVNSVEINCCLCCIKPALKDPWRKGGQTPIMV